MRTFYQLQRNSLVVTACLETLPTLSILIIIPGVHHVFDTSFSRTFSLLESQREFVERFQRKEQDSKSLPMMTSACPGTVLHPVYITLERHFSPLISYQLSPVHSLIKAKNDFSVCSKTSPIVLFCVCMCFVQVGFAMQRRPMGSLFFHTLVPLAPLSR